MGRKGPRVQIGGKWLKLGTTGLAPEDELAQALGITFDDWPDYKMALREVLSGHPLLEQRHRQALALRYGLDSARPPRTCKEVGQALGITTQGACQLVYKSLHLLRRELGYLWRVERERTGELWGPNHPLAEAELRQLPTCVWNVLVTAYYLGELQKLPSRVTDAEFLQLKHSRSDILQKLREVFPAPGAAHD